MDSENEGAHAPSTFPDGMDAQATFVADGWALFPDGTGNGDDKESDNDGPNLRDYYGHNAARFAGPLFGTLLNHNCLGTQDSN
jgi:hypothetical protein